MAKAKKKKEKIINWLAYRRLLAYSLKYKKRLFLGLFFALTTALAIFSVLGQMQVVIESFMGEDEDLAKEVYVKRAEKTLSFRLKEGGEGDISRHLQEGDEIISVEEIPDDKVGKMIDEKLASYPVVADFFKDNNIELKSENGSLSFALLFVMSLGLFIAMAAKGVSDYLNRYFMRWVGFRVVADLQQEIFAKLLNQSMEFHNSKEIGEMMSRTTSDTGAIRSSISEEVAQVIRAPFEILVVSIFIIWLAIKNDMSDILFLMLLGLPACLIPIFILGSSLKKYVHKTLSSAASVFARMQEALSCVRVVKAAHKEQFESERFKQENEKFFEVVVKSQRYELSLSPLTELITVGSTILFLIYCFSTDVKLPIVFMMIVAANFAYGPIKKLTKVQGKLAKASAAAERVFEYLDMDYEIPEKGDAKELKSFEQGIEFDDVSFSYDGQKTLQNISINIPKGSFVAFVGEAGSGKSTLVNMLARFYDIHGGAIRIDGLDVRDMKKKSLYDLIGFVDQTTTLFNESARYNMAYCSENVSDEELLEVAKRADVMSFLDKKDEGLDFAVGVKGTKLSGGQRQRLAIARALLKNPPILILDEATSALDNITEQTVQAAINEAMKDRTVIAIAHRLSTIKNADCIYVLDQGQLIESGSHEDLLVKEGAYARLWNTQFENQGEA